MKFLSESAANFQGVFTRETCRRSKRLNFFSNKLKKIAQRVFRFEIAYIFFEHLSCVKLRFRLPAAERSAGLFDFGDQPVLSRIISRWS